MGNVPGMVSRCCDLKLGVALRKPRVCLKVHIRFYARFFLAFNCKKELTDRQGGKCSLPALAIPKRYSFAFFVGCKIV